MPAVVADLARSLPGLILAGFLPGLALATAVAPRRSWALRAAAAPGLSAGLAGVVGVAFHDLHLPFEAATALPLLGAAAVVAVLRARRAPAPVAPASHRAVAAMAFVVGVGTAGALVFALGGQQLPAEGDAPVHGAFAAAIVRDHDALPVIDVPVERSGQVRPRTGFEAEAALVAETSAADPARAMTPIALLAVALLPLGLAVLALETTGSALAAGLAPIFGAGMIYPAFPIVFGELPLVVDSTLIVPVVCAVLAVARDGPRPAELGLIAACVVAQTAVHGTEMFTAAMVGTPLVAAVLVRQPAREVLRRAGAVGLVAAGAVLLTLLISRAPQVPSAVVPTGAGTAATTSDLFSSSIAHSSASGAISVARGFLVPSAPALVLYLLGVAAVLVTRRHRWLLAAQLLMLAAYLDVVSWGHLRRLWVPLFPWSTDDRLLSIQYWVLPILMAVGAAWTLTALGRLGLSVRQRGIAATGVVGVAAAMLVGGLTTTAHDYRGLFDSAAVVQNPDVTVLTAMSARLPAGATVASDGADSGQWVGVLNSDRLYFSKEYIQQFDSDVRLTVLDNACRTTPGPSAAGLFTGVDAVFVGSRQPATAPHRWDAACLSRIGWLHRISSAGDSGGTAAVFAVDPAAVTQAGSPSSPWTNGPLLASR